MTKEEVTVLVVSFCLALLGVLIDLGSSGSWFAFQRTGSLIVCVGIVFAALDIKSIYELDYEENLRALERDRVDIDIVFDDNQLDEEVRGSTNYLRKRSLTLKESGQRRVVLIDTGVIIAGTLIWGFGDWIKCMAD